MNNETISLGELTIEQLEELYKNSLTQLGQLELQKQQMVASALNLAVYIQQRKDIQTQLDFRLPPSAPIHSQYTLTQSSHGTP